MTERFRDGEETTKFEPNRPEYVPFQSEKFTFLTNFRTKGNFGKF